MNKFNGLGIAAITIVVIPFTLIHQILFLVALKGLKALGHPGVCLACSLFTLVLPLIPLPKLGSQVLTASSERYFTPK